ncbi:copper amine oxidase N-terminal domain-containing protein [Paenalkalicoccus suaedae]|uniref:Copper amine oxidase N-terminal domain-containing protein n=1 Tax=Paenalkalicoccus suaedae TaxID=2592382 RepID=A0A859FED5_9BACI|nr:copper amine oxidase N-terminal domain-containing protein [Paenalkalicoccus suaedae]QKS71281.1 copper amine oxidase N-terminal domain-containing protein [Paenalkalicoccus suaedae]
MKLRQLAQKLVLVGVACSLVLPANAHASTAVQAPVSVILNGEPLVTDVQARVENGTTLVPMRSIFQALDANVIWNQQDRTIRATRGESVINLTIDNQTALVNSQPTQLRVAPKVISGTTLVPLRFITESLGDLVTWDQATRTASIARRVTEPSPPLPPADSTRVITDAIVELDSFQLLDVDTVYVRNGRSFVPIVSVFQSLETTLPEIIDNTVILNEVPVTVEEYEGIKLIAATDLARAFDIRLQWNSVAKRLSFFTDNLVFRTTPIRSEEIAVPVPTRLENVQLIGNRKLFVSNSPESIYDRTLPTPSATLWDETHTNKRAKEQHRVYAHHHNRIEDQDAVFAVTVENTSEGPIYISNVKGLHRTSTRGWPAFDIGIHLAGRTLNNTLVNQQARMIQPGETAVIGRHPVSASTMVGYMYDFDVEPGGQFIPASYTIRSVVTTEAGMDVRSIKTPAIAKDTVNVHSRGSWDHSAIRGTLPTYTVGNEGVSYSISNGVTDNFFTAESSTKPNESSANRGHYGINYEVVIPVMNESSEPKQIELRLSGRGGTYSSAYRLNGTVFITPQMRPGIESARMATVTIEPGQTELKLELMHSGGSSLPAAITVQTLNE